MTRRLTLVLSLCALATMLLAQSSSAAIGRNTIDPNVTISKSGRVVTGGGPILCDRGEKLTVRLTISQASSGAYAEGTTRVDCTGDLQQWTVRTIARGLATFDESTDTDTGDACALGITRVRSDVTDIHQWCAANGVSFVTK